MWLIIILAGIKVKWAPGDTYMCMVTMSRVMSSIETNFNKIWIKIQQISFKSYQFEKYHLQKYPFYSSLNVLNNTFLDHSDIHITIITADIFKSSFINAVIKMSVLKGNSKNWFRTLGNGYGESWSQ